MLRGVVADDLGPKRREDLRELSVPDIAMKEVRALVDVVAAATAVFPEVVDDGDVVASGDEAINDLRADEARAASDEDSQNDMLLEGQMTTDCQQDEHENDDHHCRHADHSLLTSGSSCDATV